MRGVQVALLVLATSVAAAGAPGETQVEWHADWEKAFRLAKKTSRPIMVCINSRDGEQANERAASRIYRDAWFVAMSRRFVMLVVSVRQHAGDGPCPRFGRVTCGQHLSCWIKLRAEYGDEFLVPNTTNEMISPQHAWFKPDGTLLERKEYELTTDQLLSRMRAALVAVPGGLPAALDEKDKAQLRRFESGNDDARWAALGVLFAGDKVAVHAALVALAKKTRSSAHKRDLLRGFSRARVPAGRVAAEALLKDKEAEIRSRAAVCLERMAPEQSVGTLLKRARAERDASVRKNLYRALGACGGPVAHKAAAKGLLKAVADDKQKVVRKHAALALRDYAGAGSKLVLRRLERLAVDTKDHDVRQAIVYALAYVGNQKTTVRVLEKVLQVTYEEWRRSFVQSAIDKLQGKQMRFATSWLFHEDRTDPARKE